MRFATPLPLALVPYHRAKHRAGDRQQSGAPTEVALMGLTPAPGTPNLCDSDDFLIALCLSFPICAAGK